MTTRRNGAVALVFLAMTQVSLAQGHLLKEDLKAGDCFRLHLEMNLTGEIRVVREDKSTPLPLTARATHDLVERILSVAESGTTERAVRHYETATAEVVAAGERSTRTLRPERRLLVAQRQRDMPLLYAPNGMLTREELELTAEHFDLLGVTGILPGREVAVGDTWKVASATIQALCHFEGLTEHEVTGKLEEIKEGMAHISLTGPAQGIELGALVKVKIAARGRFDLEKKRLTWLEWKQEDDRQQGPASPAMTGRNTTTLTRTLIERPETLGDAALVSVPSETKVPEHLTSVEYRDPKGAFEVVHARDWQVVGTPPGKLVLRLMERGDFVAQATITAWPSAPKGRRLSDDEFRAAMARTPGWEPERELQAGDVPAGEGRYIYRLSVLGKMDGAEVMQNFFLVAGENGEQAVVAITLTPKKAEQLGSRDLSLASGVEFSKKP